MTHPSKNSRPYLLSLSFSMFFCSGSLSPGLQIRSYTSSLHDRFLNYPSATTTAPNPTFLYANHDFTGVAWDSNNTQRQFAVVSPLHFVGANHFKPSNNARLRFVNANGNIISKPILSSVTVPNPGGGGSDLFLGTLESPISESNLITILPYLNLPTEADYQGEEIITFGTTARAGRGEIESFTTSTINGLNPSRVFRFRYHTTNGAPNDAYAEAGDSGSPSLAIANGTPSLVGTHSYIGAQGPFLDTFDVFVPHYIAELNTLMASQGYHMTARNPDTTTLTLNANPPSTIRAGYPFTLPLTITNTGPADANNLKLINTIANGFSLDSFSSPDWFTTANTGTTLTTRLAGLPDQENTDFSLLLMPVEPGMWMHQLSHQADEMPLTSTHIPLTVLPSFIHWAENLSDPSTAGDDDDDGLVHLLEYAFGGDPTVSSPFFPGSSTLLLPTLIRSRPGTVTLSHLQRSDATSRGLTYTVECSPAPPTTPFADAADQITASRTLLFNANFDLREHDFSTASGPLFLRVRIDLEEAPL